MGAGKLSKWFKCSREDIYNAKAIFRQKKVRRLPKVLIFDIETTPSITYTWRRFNENISLDQVIQDPIVLTWSAKWLYDNEIMSDCITKEEVSKFDDSRVVKSLWKLLNEAEITIAHNGDSFDTALMNARFIIHRLPPPTTAITIDTKKIASKQFRFPSNKLDALASYFGISNKIHTEFSLWVGCIHGDQESLDKMLKYNKHDVEILEEVYLRLRPYIKGHPNVGLYLESEEAVCPNCGSKHLHLETKEYYTPTGRYSIYRCGCGALSKCRHNNLDKEVKNNLVVSVLK